MNVGELFVSLGVKGSEKTIQAFTSVKTSLGDMKSMSLETKAAIIGAVYALERLTSTSNKLGSTLTNTSALLGIPIKTLQQYSNAAELAGASSQDMLNTLGQIQSKMKSMNLNEGVPKWMGRLSEKTGFNFTGQNVEDFANHPDRFIQLLQSYAQKEKDVPWRNEVLKQFVGSQAIDSAIVRGKFNSKNLNKIPMLNDGEVKNLNSNREKFTEIALKLQRDFDKLNSGKGVTEFTESLLHLVDAIDKLENKFGFFEKIGKAFSFVGSEINVVSWALRLISGESPESVRKDIPADSFMGTAIREMANSSTQQNSGPKIEVNVDARGNANGNDIANKIGKTIEKVFDQRINQAPRANSGQTKARAK